MAPGHPPMPPTQPPSRRAGGPALAVFLACLAVYHANGRPQAEIDCVAAPYTAWALVRHGTLDISTYPDVHYLVESLAVRRLPDGTMVSIRTPGSAVAAVPFVVPFALLREQPFGSAAMMALGKLSAAVCSALAAALFFLLVRRVAPAAAWPATVLFALGTSMWSVASQSLWTHGPATLGVMAALYWLWRDETDFRTALLAGGALGLAVLVRPTCAFFGLATGAAFLMRGKWKELGGLALGSVGPLLVVVWYQHCYFGNVLLGGYDHDAWDRPAPWWLGTAGLLVAPSRGLLVYSPGLLLCPVGAWVLWKKATWPRTLGACWLAGCAATVVFYGRWHDWRGGWCYGPRFLCEVLPFVCLLAALGWSALGAGWARVLAGGLVGLSVLVHALGAFGHSGYVEWHERHGKPDDGLCLFELSDTQIEAHARAVAAKLARPFRP